MNRLFHARIGWYQYFFLMVLAVNAFGFLWCKYIIWAALMMLLLVVLIEQIIHTTYTITSGGQLLLSYGRFMPKKTIELKDITSVKKFSSMKFGRFSVTDYVLVEYGKAKYVSLLPVKEREFMELMEKRMSEI